MDNQRHKYAKTFTSKHRTKSEYVGECDINKIVARAKKTGALPPEQGLKSYAELAEIGDFQTIQNKILNAQTQFQTLPSNIRKKFNNNIGQLIKFLNNPNNVNEAIEIGLLSKPVPPPKPPITEPSVGAPESAK